ncbi:MAG: M15 family metallopeptidase [Pseudohongiellaceae bacterium]
MTVTPARIGPCTSLPRRLLSLGTVLLLLQSCQSIYAQSDALNEFVDLVAAVPGLHAEPRYFGSDNFVGRPIDGYEAPRLLATREAAAALLAVQESLTPFGLGLKLFDAYRPQRAVDHFVRWARDLDDQRMKRRFYPETYFDFPIQ